MTLIKEYFDEIGALKESHIVKNRNRKLYIEARHCYGRPDKGEAGALQG
jgi:hypothetical protein